MEKIKIAILFGGCSEEHNISLKSAHTVLTNIDKTKYDVTMVGITKSGEWFKFEGAPEHVLNGEWASKGICTPAIIGADKNIHGLILLKDNKMVIEKIDVVFPVLHGKYGEDGTIQGLLELSGITYIGCNVHSSVMCMNKDLASMAVKNAEVNVTPSVILYNFDSVKDRLNDINKLKYPLFVKPANSGSSFGVTKVNEQCELNNAVSEAKKYSDRILIEQGVDGCEIGCSILGKNNNLIVGEVDQIVLTHGFFRIHQEEKPEEKSENSTINVPAKLSAQITKKAKETAKIIYNALGCTGLARVDMFLTPQNEIVFNEVNSMPGFTCYSRYPRMMKAAGISISEVIDRLVKLTLE